MKAIELFSIISSLLLTSVKFFLSATFGAFIAVLPSMAENTRLRDLQQHIQTLQQQLQTQDEASINRFTEFKNDILSLFDEFQEHILTQLPTISPPSSQPGILGPPPSPPLPPPPPLDTNRYRNLKLEFPRFSTGDPTDWLYQVDRYCRYSQIPDTDRLLLVSIHLDHPASRWFQGSQSAGHFPNWTSFQTALLRRFGPTEFDDPAGSLMKLTQTTSVLEYQANFEDLSSRVDGLSSSLLRSTFLSGLKPHIRRAVIPQRPQDLHEAFALARIFEDQFKDDRPPQNMATKNFHPHCFTQSFPSSSSKF